MKWPSFWPFSFFTFLLFGLEGNYKHAAGALQGPQWSSQRKLAARETTRELWYHGFNNYMRHAFPLDELAPLSCTGRGPDWHNPEPHSLCNTALSGSDACLFHVKLSEDCSMIDGRSVVLSAAGAKCTDICIWGREIIATKIEFTTANIAANDVAGNFSVTLIDALDTFVILNDRPGFEDAVRNIINLVSFDVNTKPQLFETTIRVLGGLLSGHIFANQTGQPFHIPWYSGQLLDMAHNLGERLLPAFVTPTGIPYARLNLRHGLQKGESVDTCTAGAGSLILEFGTLSRLTGDDRFEKAAYKAFFALWNRKSDIGLVGNTINAWTGAWLQPEVSGVGAGIDSFYEYALKWYVMSGEVEFLDVWQESYAAVMRYSRSVDGFWFRSVNIHTGDLQYGTLDSLSAFWPGLQVLGGDIENAIKSHMTYWNLWKSFSGLPEVWDMNFKQATSMQYPLRPEFVESTWYLYRATRDPFYLDVGRAYIPSAYLGLPYLSRIERILEDITLRARVDCGITGISDLRKNTRENRMESFVLSETLKYLYLLFDEENPLHSDDSNYVLTTEGHVLTLDRAHQKPISTVRRKMRGVEHLQCPAYRAPILAYDNWELETGMVGGIRSRIDVDYPRELVNAPILESDRLAWSPNGWCEMPKVNLYSYDFILSPRGKTVPEDLHPSSDKIVPVADGYLLQNITGIRAHIVSRLDGKGYDVTKLGPHAVKTGQIVYVSDTDLQLAPLEGKGPIDGSKRRQRNPEIELRFFLDHIDPILQVKSGLHDIKTEAFVTASTALFGGDPAEPPAKDTPPLRFGHGEGVRVVHDPSNPLGCEPYAQPLEDAAVMVQRGDCTFLEKLQHAQKAGASGVVAINYEEFGVNPSADAGEIAAIGDTLDDVVIVVLGWTEGELVRTMLEEAEGGAGRVMVAAEPGVRPPIETRGRDTKPPSQGKNASKDIRVLYLNGHPLLNTRLLV